MKQQVFIDLFDLGLLEGVIINDRMEGFKFDYMVLHLLLRKYKATSCFECGTHTGFGTKIIKNAIGESGVVFSLDLPDEQSSLSKQHPLSEGKKGVGFECDLPFVSLRGDSRTFPYENYPCDAYWVDDEHTTDHVEKELSAILKLKPKLIILHDTDMPEVMVGIMNVWNKEKPYDEYELIRVTDTRISYLLKKELI